MQTDSMENISINENVNENSTENTPVKGNSVIHKVIHVYNKTEEYVLLVMLTLTVIFVFYQVFMRYVFNDAPHWTEEISRYLFIWFSWLGTSLGLRSNEHIRIQILENSLINRGHLKAKTLLMLFIYLVWIGFTIALAILGFQFVSSLVAMNTLSTGLRLPLSIVAVSVPVACTAVSIRLVARIYSEIIKLKNGGAE